MERMRSRFQGVWNIIRFNRHFYVLAGLVIFMLFGTSLLMDDCYREWTHLAAIFILAITLFTLAVSCYIYDFSGFYNLRWLPDDSPETSSHWLNIHAGFDETSALLAAGFPGIGLSVFDFYDPAKHTEPSIRRARKAYPAYPGTQQIVTHSLPLADGTIDKALLILAAHEIRNEAERVTFFTELRRILTPSGQIVIAEHLRDAPNFIAYNLGFFHFLSQATWLNTFRKAGLTVYKQQKINPFITLFVLNKNGSSS